MPMHIEHPDERHWAPAALKILSRPSASASIMTLAEPGTMIMSSESATLRPSSTFAATRRSSIRPLVQEPMKTMSTATSRMDWPAVSSMYSRADSAAERSTGSEKSSGDGTGAESWMPWPGLVPHVTNGASVDASITISLSYVASASVRSEFQYSTAASQFSPVGAWG